MNEKIMLPTGYYTHARAFLQENGYTIVDCPSTATSEERSRIMADCDGIIARTEKYEKDMIARASNLKIIARAGVGYDNVPIDYCTEKKVQVTFTPQANFIPVAEHSMGLMLALAHRTCLMDSSVKTGNWKARDQHKGCEVYGKTLGIIGCGRIGRKFAEMAHFGLGMKILAFDSFLRPDQFPEFCEALGSIDQLLKESDFVSIHVPSNAETRHMVNLDFCRKMKDDAFLINCARGDLVDEPDLYTALKDHVIAGAAVDVMENEPVTDSPLFELNNFIVTPHFAALNNETIERMGMQAAECVHAVLSGNEPQWALNKLR